jgi:hypothetical protein
MKIYIKDMKRFSELTEEYSQLNEAIKNEKDPIKYQETLDRIVTISDELEFINAVDYE